MMSGTIHPDDLPTEWFLSELQDLDGAQYSVLTLVVGEDGWEQEIAIPCGDGFKAAVRNAIQQARDHVKAN